MKLFSFSKTKKQSIQSPKPKPSKATSISKQQVKSPPKVNIRQKSKIVLLKSEKFVYSNKKTRESKSKFRELLEKILPGNYGSSNSTYIQTQPSTSQPIS